MLDLLSTSSHVAAESPAFDGGDSPPAGQAARAPTDRESYALIEVQVRTCNWRPDIKDRGVKDPRATPKRELPEFSVKQQGHFAKSFNEAAINQRQNKFAFLLASGGVFILHKIARSTLPADSLDIPEFAERPWRSRCDAMHECELRNAEILAAGGTPKTWWVAVRDISMALA